MADWVAISSLATAGGTLALAATTYASVRSANRAARAAELSLLAELRPLLIQSSEGDPVQRVNFMDELGFVVPGGEAAVQVIDTRFFLVISLRNVGPGIAVLHGGSLHPEPRRAVDGHTPVDGFHLLTRDIYIPSAKVGFWQIALRGRDDPERFAMIEAVDRGEFSVEILYGDYEGGQRVITLFRILRESDGVWRPTAVRHWQVDRSDPR
jgi:hypothetical protein